MKVGVLHRANYLVVPGRKTWEELAVHPHQLRPTCMSLGLTHVWLALVQVVGL